jgi:hypothetical protein
MPSIGSDRPFSTEPASPADHSMSALAESNLVLVRTRIGAKGQKQKYNSRH